MSWRDDLPDIPSDRIRERVIGEGRDRRAAARQRRMVAVGSSMAAGLVLIVGGLVVLSDRDERNGDAATEDTAAAEATAAPTEPEATTGDTAPAATSQDSAASATTEAAGATVPIRDVRAEPTTVWEVPATGQACGPIHLTVAASLDAGSSASVIVRTAGGLRVEESMTITGSIGSATFPGFPDDAVASGGREDLLLEIVVTDAAGVTQSVAGPVVELRDCTP